MFVGFGLGWVRFGLGWIGLFVGLGCSPLLAKIQKALLPLWPVSCRGNGGSGPSKSVGDAWCYLYIQIA